MKFIYEKTRIPVPEVICYWIHESKNYILMKRIDGETLESQWEKISSQEKDLILSQLKKYIDELRRLKFKYIGSINKNPGYEPMISDQPFGPFDNLEKMYKFRIKNIGLDKLNQNDRILRNYIDNLDFTNINILGNSDNFTLTHTDLGPYNILIKNSSITAILDWEGCGSYPFYWEYIRTLFHRAYSEEWKEIIKNILSSYRPVKEIEDLERFICYIKIYLGTSSEEIKDKFKTLLYKLIN